MLSTRAILIGNNLSALAIYILMVPVFALSVFFLFSAIAFLWVVYFALYAWIGYRFLSPTKKPHLFSVLGLLALLMTVSVAVILTTTMSQDVLFLSTFFNIWTLFLPMTLSLLAQDTWLSESRHILTAGMMLAACIPTLSTCYRNGAEGSQLEVTGFSEVIKIMM